MQIIVDIPNGCYEELNNGQFPIQEAYRLVAWIKNGTPLSEGCEKLISANEFKKAYTTTKWNEGIHRIIYEKTIDGKKTNIEGWIFDRKG